MNRRRAWIPWVVTLGIGALITVSMLLSARIFDLTDPLEVYSKASDAFFVPGILMLSFGILGLISREGVFDMAGYGMKSLLVLFTPFRKPEKHEKYYEYRQRKHLLKEKKQSPVLFVCGIIFIAAAGVCLLLYALAGGL